MAEVGDVERWWSVGIETILCIHTKYEYMWVHVTVVYHCILLCVCVYACCVCSARVFAVHMCVHTSRHK